MTFIQLLHSLRVSDINSAGTSAGLENASLGQMSVGGGAQVCHHRTGSYAPCFAATRSRSHRTSAERHRGRLQHERKCSAFNLQGNRCTLICTALMSIGTRAHTHTHTRDTFSPRNGCRNRTAHSANVNEERMNRFRFTI